MFSYERPTKIKNYWKHSSSGRLWIAIVIVTIACGTVGRAESSRMVRDVAERSNRADCAARDTCTECAAAAPACSWSLVEQTCSAVPTPVTTTEMPPATTQAQTTSASTWTPTPTSPTQPTTAKMTEPPTTQPPTTQPPPTTTTTTEKTADPLTVYDVGSCPVYTVNINRSADTVSLAYAVTVTVSNDDTTGAFGSLIARGPVACGLTDRTVAAAVEDGGHRVTCVIRANSTTESSAPASTPAPGVIYFAVMVAGVPLEFDNRRDHYVTVYHNACDAEERHPTAECVSCNWDDGPYRYFCRWCPRNNECTGLYQHCDVREKLPTGRGYAPTALDAITVRCPAIRIESIEPEYGPWAGGTTMRIAIANHRVISENRIIVVTVAGRRCLLPTKDNSAGGLTCTISPANSSALNDGPVEVTYKSKGDHTQPPLTLRSDRTFYFVDPDITDMQPSCGPVAGGTSITIRGNFLNAGNTVRVYTQENISCTVTKHTQNAITCVTGASLTPSTAKVKLEFDTYLTKYVSYPMYQYSGDPVVDDNQTFSGMVSGGTWMPVRGRYFSCLNDPFLYMSRNGVRHSGRCTVTNDTYMMCTTPKMNRPAPRVNMSLLFGFIADLDNRSVKFRPARNDSYYTVHPDPVCTDFESDDNDRTLSINGLHLNHVHFLPDDLVIRYHGTQTPCNVTAVMPRRIVCTALKPDPSRDELVVVMGQNLMYDVKRKFARYHHSMHLTIIFAVITFVSLIITFAVAVVYCTKIALIATNQQQSADAQSLYDSELHNINCSSIAVDDHPKGDRDRSGIIGCCKD